MHNMRRLHTGARLRVVVSSVFLFPAVDIDARVYQAHRHNYIPATTPARYAREFFWAEQNYSHLVL